jgi:hypothetical protein
MAEMLEKFVGRLDEFNRIKKELSEELQKDFAPLLQEILTTNQFPFIQIRGYTPGFNDGDVCEHTMYVEADVDEVIQQFEDADFSNLTQFENMRYGDDQYKVYQTVDSTISSIGDLMYIAFDTNWKINAAFDANGEFHYDFSEYDCEY